jgi:metal-sulfur cluster biosynthetic enzyme
MTAANHELETQVRERLDEVLDPCSTFTERPQSIVDLGLVDGVDIDAGSVTVYLLPTNQLCMYIPHMAEEIETRVEELSAVDSVTVEVVADKVWTRARMTSAAKREREAHFESRVEAHEVTPAYDGESWSEEIEAELTGPTDGR